MARLTVGTPEEAGMDPDRIAKLRDQAPAWVDGFRSRSFVGLAARRGKIVFHEAYGPLTHEQDSPSLKRDSLFSVASCTKPLTATAAMMLVEDGRLGLNRPLKEYLPNFCGTGIEDVEVQHLFTHTTGFTDADVDERILARRDPLLQSDFKGSSGQHQYAAISMECLKDLPSRWQPGSRMDYNGENYNILGEIVRIVSGQGLDDFVRKRIFEPLGMADTFFGINDDLKHRWVRRAEGEPGGPVPDQPLLGMEGDWFQKGVWGSGNLTTTALDLAKFAQMFLDGGICEEQRLISPATHAEMTRNQIPGIDAKLMNTSIEASWGLGWQIQGNFRWRWGNSTLQPAGSYGHGGFGGSCFWIDPENELIGVYLSVCTDLDLEAGEHHWNLDLFQNMVTAAVTD
jgi:CubicO group peptidase (beta-lactamase class C family)